MQSPDLSAIVLCYRAGESIHRVIDPLYAQLEEAGVSFELVLVANHDPNRPDPTSEVVREFAGAHPHARALVGEKRGGMSWDMRSGLEAARGNYLVVIDGDAQNPIEDVLEMYRRMKQTGAQVMKGRRIARFDGWWRRIVSVGYNASFLLLFGTRGVWDVNGKPKGLTRAAYERMSLTSDGWFIDAEIVLAARRLGLDVGELPVVFRRNDERQSFVEPAAIWEFVVNMLRERFGRRPR